jgi:hypothetical protein
MSKQDAPCADEATHAPPQAEPDPLMSLQLALNRTPNAPTPGPGNTITVDTSMFLKPEGLISGPIYVRQRHTSLAAPDDVYFLPDREIVHIPGGSAIQVLSNLGRDKAHWHVIDFPDGGRLRGPLAWGWSRPLKADEARQRYAQEDGDLLLALATVGSSLLGAAGGFALGSSLPIGSLAFFSGVLIGTALAYPIGKIGWRLARRYHLSKYSEIPHSDVTVELPSAFQQRINSHGRKALASDVEHASEEGDHDKTSWPTLSTIMDFAKSQAQIDEEIRQALGTFLESCDETTSQESRTPSGSLAKAKLRHTSKKIWEISQEIAAHPSIEKHPDVRDEFLGLLRRADVSVKAFERDCDDQKCRSVLSDIRALHRQLDGYVQNTSSDEGNTSHDWEPA